MKKLSVTIIGLGHVGLPLAALLSNSGFQVLGVDIDERLIDRINSGRLTNYEPGLSALVQKGLDAGTLIISMKPGPADIHLIAVPTLLDFENQPDISKVKEAAESIKPLLRSEDLVLIESTCPIGTTQQMASVLRQACPHVSVCYCPERILPGNILHELTHNNRVVGGVDSQSTKRAIAFYEHVTKGRISGTDSRTAEAVKLAENAYRDINIAFANELSMMAEKLQIDVYEWIRLANRHPRVHILNPGAGVGGHCIAMDPWYLVAADPEKAVLTATARRINTSKTEWVIRKVRETALTKGVTQIACLGLTYKPDVSDTRESPALNIVRELEKEFHVLRVDPFVAESISLSHALVHADLLVGLVPHTTFRSIKTENLQNKIILDFAGIFHENTPDNHWNPA
ncbi:MAG: nucleotide sugar dehydrogenase [Parachlamydia sp.]|nr:nucleotide sugar dehydrogenase [Parachlamydia sp.]